MNHAETVFAIVLDVDWAPDFVIDETAALLKELGIRASWFLTHASLAIERLRDHPDFELGIHPNFLEGSTQGASEEKIIDYCLKIVPHAVSMRTHAYFQHSLLFNTINRTTNIENDASVFMPLTRDLHPSRYWTGGRYINRFPVFWEDDNELKKPEPDINFAPNLVDSPGLKIFAFHPMLLTLNSASIQKYHVLKNDFRNFNELNHESIQPYVNNKERGIKDFLENLADYVNRTSHFHLIRELTRLYEEKESSN